MWQSSEWQTDIIVISATECIWGLNFAGLSKVLKAWHWLFISFYFEFWIQIMTLCLISQVLEVILVITLIMKQLGLDLFDCFCDYLPVF